jgi:hypothetical protein
MRNQNSCSTDSTKLTFSSAPAIIVFFCLECLVVVQALLASHDHFLTVTQMQQQRGIAQGLPFIWHFAMWGDLLIVSGLVAYVIGLYSLDWHARRVLASLAIGFAAAGILHWSYTLSEIPEAHVQNHHLTIVGIVHFFYMAITLGVFTQFFTSAASTRILRVVSLLLFFHVILGTHMALGILKTITPLDWYPSHPLKSAPGWATVAAVAIGLIWRNVGTSAIVAAPKNAIRCLFMAGKWLLHIHPESAEGYLRTLDYFCGFIGFLYFGDLFVSRWRQGANPWSLALLFLTGVVYYLSRLSVAQELDIARSLFLPNRFPDELQLKDRLSITLQVVLFMLLYITLGWAASNIMIASLCMTIIGCVDFNTRRVINQKVRLYFSSPEYAVHPSEAGYKIIRKKRRVIRWFLFKLPHLWKEAGRTAGCVVALCIASFGHRSHNERLNTLAYEILVATLTVNEIITLWWRILRDRKL